MQKKGALITAGGSGFGAGFTLLRVVRDPTKRLVSSFRHAMRYQLLNGLVQEMLGVDPTNVGLSLQDFEAALTGEDMTKRRRVDVHVSPQAHPVWDLGFDRVITLNIEQTDMTTGLNAVEADLGLPITDFAALDARTGPDAHRYARDMPYTGTEPLESVRFQGRPRAGFPKRQFAALPLVNDISHRFYSADHGRVESGDTAGRLFQRD